MVFHLIPALAVAGVKYVIKEATDAPTCGKCGREKMKMWAGFRIIFLCEDCENGMEVKLGLKAVQIATFGFYMGVLGQAIGDVYDQALADDDE
ncbi:uncharacterized protein FMAN_11204 [Fusarium mangiferae]|uniref:Uncharacterized protein n=1 Tax=Fusarium mangiferae TaxID=192010 RepID=A0A1L7TDY8_FUSMA|nr:uncharacterized protein FMAN_11204 [Fusarium mangiferae]CVK96910.1 uncharacterized protein FMAN_11204 [Fusarium mangiferae]